MNRQERTMSQAEVGSGAVDTGLRAYMLRVYNYMSLGVAFTAALAMLVASSPAAVQAIQGGLFWVLFIGVLGLGWFAPKLMLSKSVGAAQACFWAYAAMWGALLGPMFAQYTGSDSMTLVRAFAITAATFAGTSLAGYTTKKDPSVLASSFLMATICGAVAVPADAFLIQSTGFELVLSIGVVLLFSGITAWETQQIKTMYAEADAGDVQTRKAVFGAFMLYGSFVTLFIHILNILGIMDE